jgi:hypothetical protein
VLGRREHIDLMWSRAELHIMNIKIIKKSSNRWTRCERDEERWGDMIQRGPRGNYSWVLIQPTFLKLLSLCITFYLLLSVHKADHLTHVRGWV